MSTQYPTVPAAIRTEFGKGFARRLRVAGQVPGVVYGPTTEPIHFSVDRIALTAVVRNDGVNAVIELDVEGEKHLTMIKHIDQNVLTFDIDHIDLLAIKRGEKVEVEVPLLLEGESTPGTLAVQETDTIRIEADVLNIPEELTFSVEGLDVGERITAVDIAIGDATLIDEADLLIATIVYPEVEEEETAEGEEEAAADKE
ncbi:General stress protein CTC [Corynebacterium occultum]|uniref:Large ribosomal subunit protein bL25 n=1 Tax=Corynebacterium occultum TaxID=2675219 RepID=A0A6B8VRS5_9CORY|nr:50S ribosomal protein L25/general stress protein Ctc [Corynebacterium occultum]QGU06823.1 General stress protein CTC [Corynebacterium occultum]